MEWVAFVVSLALITCGYLIIQFQRIEKKTIKKIDEFLDRYNDHFNEMSEMLESRLQEMVHRVYDQNYDDFAKVRYQAEQIIHSLHEIRILADARDKNEKQIMALKAAIERYERRLKKYAK